MSRGASAARGASSAASAAAAHAVPATFSLQPTRHTFSMLVPPGWPIGSPQVIA